jgi:hypothetical protein
MIIAYEIRRGARFRLIAVGTQDNEKIHLPYLEFQEEALRRAATEWPKLVRIMDHTAEAGPPKDEEKSKPLREGIFEFRTKGGLRLLCFMMKGALSFVPMVTSNKDRKRQMRKSTQQFNGRISISPQNGQEG